MSDLSPEPVERRSDPIGNPRIGGRRTDAFFSLDGNGRVSFTTKGALAVCGLLTGVWACWPKVEAATRIVNMPTQLDSARADLRGWTDTTRHLSVRVGTVEEKMHTLEPAIVVLGQRMTGVEEVNAAQQARMDAAKAARDRELSEQAERLRALESRARP